MGMGGFKSEGRSSLTCCCRCNFKVDEGIVHSCIGRVTLFERQRRGISHVWRLSCKVTIK